MGSLGCTFEVKTKIKFLSVKRVGFGNNNNKVRIEGHIPEITSGERKQKLFCRQQTSSDEEKKRR
jgi:hypothetical protein